MSGFSIDVPEALVERVAVRVAEILRPLIAESSSASAAGWMTSAQAADYLGMSRNALHKLTSAREIPFSQDAPGGKCWFQAGELDEWRRSRS
jgi:excisionase family DNA binding protein